MDKFLFKREVFRSFIGYKNDKIVKSLCVLLPKISGYVSGYVETNCVFFFNQKGSIDRKIQSNLGKLVVLYKNNLMVKWWKNKQIKFF